MGDLVEVDEHDAVELFFERGWTDGLPVVPPTPGRVDALIATGQADPEQVVASIEQRGLSVTVEEAAINAVMAGCLPEYFPVVLAGLRAMGNPEFNAHPVLASTGGPALGMIVSGPYATTIGMNAGGGLLGPGNRANATIGRALRLVAMNVFGARPDMGMDGSSFGHPGKYSLCFAEASPPAPWQSLRESLGYADTDTTVTLLGLEGPRQVNNRFATSARDVLLTLAAAIRSASTYCAGKGGQLVIVLGPEHQQIVIGDGWSRRACQEFVADHSRVTEEELDAWGVGPSQSGHQPREQGPGGRLPTVLSPEDIFIVTAGGPGSGWSSFIPVWAPKKYTVATTELVHL